jgi:hypothetical protein
MSEFKIGDRVRVTETAQLFAGRLGTVKEIERGHLLVKIDGNRDPLFALVGYGPEKLTLVRRRGDRIDEGWDDETGTTFVQRAMGGDFPEPGKDAER